MAGRAGGALKRATGRSIAFFVAALGASCAPFAANNSDDAGGPTGDAGGPTGDASVLDASGASDQRAPDSGPFYRQDGGFCGQFSDAIACFDFDEANPPPGLTLVQMAGTTTFQPTFAGGSPPTALVVTTTKPAGRTTATPAAIDLAQYANTTVTVDFRFSVSAVTTAIEYLARVNFTHQSSPIAFSAGNTLQCGGGTFMAIAPGVHSISLKMPLDGTGTVTTFSCSFDGSSEKAAPVAASTTLSVELGNEASGSGNFVVSYDDLVVRAH